MFRSEQVFTFESELYHALATENSVPDQVLALAPVMVTVHFGLQELHCFPSIHSGIIRALKSEGTGIPRSRAIACSLTNWEWAM